MRKTAVFFRFIAILAVVFIGITIATPKSTVKDDEASLPVFSDVSDEDISCVRTVYLKNLMQMRPDGTFDVDGTFTVSEGLYAAICIYEDRNETDRSFNGYNNKDFEKYKKKAAEYGINTESLPTEDTNLLKHQAACIFAAVVPEDTDIKNFSGAGEISESASKLYSMGITLEENINKAYTAEEITRIETAKLIDMIIYPEKRAGINPPDYEALEASLKEKMSGYQGDWSLYFEDRKYGGVISINSHQVYSASLIKLFVTQTVYQRAYDGTLTVTDKTRDEIRKMITYSDNEAWKYLARLLGGGSYSKGMAEVTKTAQAAGFSDTGQFYQGSHKNYNFTSVNDCGIYLRRVLDGEMVSPEYSEKILELLKQQQHTQKIPAGVPDSVGTANKTGELEYNQGDAAIVYAPNGTYILVVIGDELDDGYGQVPNITELSKTVYEFLN